MISDWQNGWQVVHALMDSSLALGLLMYLSLGLALVGAVLAIVSAARCLTKSSQGVKTAVVSGYGVMLFIAGAAAPAFYFLSSVSTTSWAIWLHCVALVLCTVGEILLKIAHYPAQPVSMQPGFAQPFTTAQPNGYRLAGQDRRR